MITHQYLVFTEEDVVHCATEALAETEAENLIQNLSLDDVAIYKLVKRGKRRSAVQWETETAKAESIPERPPYRGPNSRWSEAEVTYLQEARKMGMSFIGIAKKLGRTPHAVEVKFARL